MVSNNEIKLKKELNEMTKNFCDLKTKHENLERDYENLKMETFNKDREYALNMKQNEETLKNFREILEDRDSIKAERELIKKNKQLMLEIQKCRKLIFKLKSTKSNFRSTRITNTKQRASFLDNPDYKNFLIELDLKKNNIKKELALDEIEEEEEEKNNKNLNLNKLSSLEDRKSNLKEYLNERKSDLGENGDLVINFVNKEIEQNQKMNNREYMDMIEKMQGILNEVEKEKTGVMEEYTELNLRFNDLEIGNEKLKIDYGTLQNQYNNILGEYDMANLKNKELFEKCEKLEIKLKKMEEKAERDKGRENLKYEKDVDDLNLKIEHLLAEKGNLDNRLKNIIEKKMGSDDMAKIQKDRLEEIIAKNEKFIENNEKLISQNKKLKEEVENLTEDNKNKCETIEEIKKEFFYQSEKKEIEFNNKLKKKIEELNSLKHERISKMDGTSLMGSLGTNLGNLNFKENDFGNNRESDLINGLNLRTNTDLNFHIPESGRNIDIIPEEDEDLDFFDLEENDNFKEIEKKDKEIIDLREEILELRKKMDKSDYNKLKKLEEKIKELNLQLKHLEQQFETFKLNSNKEIEHWKKENKEMEDLLIEVKMKFQIEIADKDHNELKIMKKIKLLNYQIGLYEKQISDFNKKS